MKPKIIFENSKEYLETINYFVEKASKQGYEMETTFEILEEIFDNQTTKDGGKLNVNLNAKFNNYKNEVEITIKTHYSKATSN